MVGKLFPLFNFTGITASSSTENVRTILLNFCGFFSSFEKVLGIFLSVLSSYKYVFVVRLSFSKLSWRQSNGLLEPQLSLESSSESTWNFKFDLALVSINFSSRMFSSLRNFEISFNLFLTRFNLQLLSLWYSVLYQSKFSSKMCRKDFSLECSLFEKSCFF